MADQQPYIIGISGGSGSGKTCIIRDIKERYTADQVCIVSQDNYYKPRELQQKDDSGIINFDLPTCINNDKLHADVQQLISGQDVELTEYVFNNAKATASVINMKPAPVIILEGLFVFYQTELMDLMDLKIFVDAKENLKLIRRIKRDGKERNYPIDDVLYRYEHHVLPSFEQYIFPYKKECDLVIKNNDTYKKGLEVLMAFIQNKI